LHFFGNAIEIKRRGSEEDDLAIFIVMKLGSDVYWD